MSGHWGKNLVIVLALVAAGFFAAYLRFRSHLGNEGVFTDGETLYEDATGEGVRYAVWERPEMLPAHVNTEARESRPAISPDGSLLVFCVGQEGLNSDLYVAELVQGHPTNPRPLDAVNTSADECAPAFGPYGLYFASNREGGEGGFDIYQVEYQDGYFGLTRRLAPGINTEKDETDPAPVPGTESLAFATDRGSANDFDLFLARLDERVVPGDEEHYVVEPLGPLNTLFEEREPSFAGSGHTIVFASDRDGSVGGFDIYRSVLSSEGWAAPQAVVGLNTAESERGPYASPGGFTLHYAVEDESGRYSDIFRAHTRELFRLPGKPVGWLDLIILASLLLLALLAFLAKRWSALDIVYKCFLISIVIHALLIWWFRDVVPESSEFTVPGKEDSTFKVRIAIDPTRDLADARERAGQLETARSQPQPLEMPQRNEAVAMEAAPADAPSRELDRAEAPEAQTPERSLSESQPTEVARDVQPTHVQQPTEQFEKIAGEAPALAMAEQSMPDFQAPTNSEALDRTESSARNRVSEVAPQARNTDLAARQLEAGPQAEAAARQMERREMARVREPGVNIQVPAEQFDRRAGDAPALALTEVGPAAVPQHPDAVANPDRNATAAAAPTAVQPSARAETIEAESMALAMDSVKRDSSQTQRLSPTAVTEPAVPMQDAPEADPLKLTDRAADAPALALPEVARSDATAPERGAEQALERSAVAAEMSDSATGTNAPAADTLGLQPAEMPSATASRREAPTWEPTRRNVTQPAVAVNAPEVTAPVREPAEAEAGPAEPDFAPTALAATPRSSPESTTGPARQNFTPSASSRSAVAADLPEVSLDRPKADESEPPVAARAESDFSPALTNTVTPEVALRAPEAATELSPAEGPPLVQLEESGSPEGDLAPLAMTGRRGAEQSQPSGPLRQTFGHEMDAPESRPAERPIMADVRQDPVERSVAAPTPTKWEHTPYKDRFGDQKVVALKEHGGSEETERAVQNGLKYLASIQKDQGHWGTHHYYHGKYGYTAIGKTGLSLLAFLGAGHTPDSDSEYSRNASRAVDFLLGVQDEATGHFSYTSSYGHGIATYALAECYALTKDKRLKRPLERAVAHIIRQQNKVRDRRLYGGWSYYYSDERTYDQWPRASITAWQVMALESAHLSGIAVPDEVFEAARGFLLSTQDEARGFFRYSHDPERLKSNYPTLPGSTPASIFALAILGEDPNDARFEKAREFVLKRAPKQYRYTSGDDFVYRASGNIYFWYYGTLAMFRCGGTPWELWNDRLKATLLPVQNEDGSWTPISLYADYAGDTDEDRTYTTAMCVLILEVYYRYFTPLLQIK